MNSIFEAKTYKQFLQEKLKNRGDRSRLADAIPCHNGYVSQVLKGSTHFSLEQAERINAFFGHGRDESHCFLLLLQKERAGTTGLRAYFQEQLNSLREKRLVLRDRLQFQRSVSPEDQAIFYSSWHYAAAHVLVSVPGCDTDRGLAEYFGLPLERTREIVRFLVSIGLLKEGKGRLSVGPSSVHLSADSPLISKHHANWRLRAIQSLDRRIGSDLHYSSVITASRDDAVRVRELLVKAIEEIRSVVRASPNEAGFVYAVDFFGLRSEGG